MTSIYDLSKNFGLKNWIIFNGINHYLGGVLVNAAFKYRYSLVTEYPHIKNRHTKKLTVGSIAVQKCFIQPFNVPINWMN